MESKDRIPQNFDVLDLSRAMNSFKREQIRKILELPDHQSFSVVRWYSPAEVKPIEATYVMAKLYEPGIGFICIGAAYEHGRLLGARSIEGQAAGNRSCVGLVLSSPG